LSVSRDNHISVFRVITGLQAAGHFAEQGYLVVALFKFVKPDYQFFVRFLKGLFGLAGGCDVAPGGNKAYNGAVLVFYGGYSLFNIK
jgi:hypothetical protein